jgi:hypothetical protein
MDVAHARDAHPDEGTIHAWLDGALDAASAAAVAAHVAGCAACSARVAEARGLIAEASRIVGALDEAPSGVAPSWEAVPASGTAVGARSAWRRLRVTPARAAIAAALLVAVGVTLTYDRTGQDTIVSTSTPAAASGNTMAGRPAARGAMPDRGRDPVLDSGVSRNLAAAQPPRTVQAAPNAGQPVPPTLEPPARAVPATDAAKRVAVGRAAVQAQRESTSAVADRAQVAGQAPGVPTTERATVAAAKVAESVATTPPARRGQAGAMTVSSAATTPPRPECYRVESAGGSPATWGRVPLPFIVMVAPGATTASVLTSAGVETGSRATLGRAGGDSLLFRLRRAGYHGTLALGAPGEVRAGVMRSAPSAAPAAAAARGAVAAPAPAAISAQPAVPVVARKVACPAT